MYKGREPLGTVEPGDYEKIRSELKEKIEAIEDPDGNCIGTKVFRPQELYKEVNGVAPDLLVYFGNLGWRSVGSVGMNSIHTFQNDTGSDEANHDWHGIFILNETGCRLGNLEKGYKEGLGIYDIAPTVLNLFGMKFDEETRGKSITQFEDRGIFTRLKNVWN